ncbi:SDR family NAD(P)-dependent oxidoreductase [Arthrobacter sp. KNU-44]|uniref:SDR family NAD(P)-dependent oxidoreductase n=1 Tax=Arthrobacter sp. KNU-44 TaxID=3450744 RepID=UPI003F430504
MRFLGRRVLVTGAGSGMGRSHAHAFAEEGARVILADVNVKQGREAAAAIPGSEFARLDVTSEADWTCLAERLDQNDGIDVLVNNAGVVIDSPVDEMTLDAFAKVIDINLVGAFLGIRTFLPRMAKQRHGAIVNIGSIAAFAGHRGSVAYGASKWGLRGLSKSAALEAAGSGVRVNTVHPGFVRTPMTARVDEAAVSTMPIPRFAEPAEISAAVLFLASDDASFCTGSDLVVDGGFTAGIAQISSTKDYI